MVYGLLQINWVMVMSVMDKFWAWRSTSRRKKQVEIISLTIFQMVHKERNKRVFDGIEDVDDFDILNNIWFQTLNFLLRCHSLYFMENIAILFYILVYL